jgi:hypothetical protein
MTIMRLLGGVAAAILLQACASAPRVERPETSALPVEWVKDEDATQVRRLADRKALADVETLGLPTIEIASGAVDSRISAAQSDLVVNRAARDICNGLAPYFRLNPDAAEAMVRLRILAIQPTSAGTAGLSEVVGFFVPGPFRIPAGLGGLAIDGELHRAGQPIVLLQWSQGANPLTEGARVSSIGDAYQLAGDFADDFVAAVIATPDDAQRRRARQAEAIVNANKSLCRAAFGKANVAVAGASLLIGLPPEAMDQGAPAREEAPAE